MPEFFAASPLDRMGTYAATTSTREVAPSVTGDVHGLLAVMLSFSIRRLVPEKIGVRFASPACAAARLA